MQLSRVTRRGLVAATSALGIVLSLMPTAAREAAPVPSSASIGPLLLEDDVRVPDDAAERVVAEAAATGDNRIDSLLSGYQWPVTTITYSFYSDRVFGGSYYGTETGVREVSDRVKENARAIFAWYATILGVPVVEVAESAGTVGAIRLMVSDFSGYAYTYYPTPGGNGVAGDIHLSSAYDRLGDTNGFQQSAGNHGYLALIHEIGHAFGLKHPHTGSPVLPVSEDNNTHTVMSYTFVGRSPATPMSYDVMALQYLYGARASRTGADRYVFTRSDVDQYRLGETVWISPAAATQQTIWDGGGYNVLDLSQAGVSATGYRVDTSPLGWITTVGNYQGSYVVAGTNLGPGVRIQELITSPGDDTIYLNPDANIVRGYAPGQGSGADVIVGATEADTLDLSGYSESAVTQTAVGADLVIGLGASARITLRDYYAGARMTLSFAGGGGAGTGSGNGGTPVNQPPAAAAAASPTSGVAPLTVAFSAAGSSDADGQLVSYVWTMAPGVTAGGASPQHTFTTPGTYVVSLTVTDDDGATASATTTVVVTAPPSPTTTGKNRTPVAVLAADPTSGSAPLTVQFTGQASSDPDGSIASYDWAFGNGASASGSSVSFTYTTPGTYLATLAVTDNRGAKHTQAAWITVTPGASPTNRPPVAVASATPPSGVAPLPVTFSGTGSSDPDGSVTGYSWAFGDGGTGSGATVNHTYATAGTYVATLTVTDSRGATATAATNVTVTATSGNRPPVAVVMATPLTGRAPLTVAFNGGSSSDPDGNLASYAWTFGDGGSASGVAVSHTYVAAGTYAATLTVTDALGATHSSSTPIVVSPAPASAATTMSVGAIGLQVLNDGGRWAVDAVVTVVDNEGRPVPQAVVSGRWTGMMPSAFLYAMTDTSGRAAFRSKSLNASGVVGFTVVGITRSDLTYTPSLNAVTSSSVVFTKP